MSPNITTLKAILYGMGAKIDMHTLHAHTLPLFITGVDCTHGPESPPSATEEDCHHQRPAEEQATRQTGPTDSLQVK